MAAVRVILLLVLGDHLEVVFIFWRGGEGRDGAEFGALSSNSSDPGWGAV